MKILKLFAFFSLLFASVFLFPRLCLGAGDQEIISDPFSIDDWMYDDDYSIDYDPWLYDGNEYSVDPDFVDEVFLGVFAGFAFLFVIFSFFFFILFYVYTSLTLYRIANRLNYDYSWFAWLPILREILIFQVGDQNPWLLLLCLIPFFGTIVVVVLRIIAVMNICKKYGYDSALGLLTLIPLAYYILLGILAWGREPQKAVVPKD